MDRRFMTGPGAVRVVGWLAVQALRYLLVSAVGWLVWILLLAGVTGNLLALDAIGLLLWVLPVSGYYFGLPTLLVLAVLGVVGLLASARVFRAAALIGLPLVVVALPVEPPPSVGYGAQLLFQLPIQVAYALLIRRPAAGRDDDARLLAAWGLTESTGAPGPGRDERSAGPARWWYGALAGVLAWLALLLTGGRPLVAGLVPLGRTAGPVDIAVVSLPLLGIGYVAWARRSARRRRPAVAGPGPPPGRRSRPDG